MIKNLASRMRPKTIDDVVGQQHLLGEGKIIRRMVKAKRLTSMILYGPPGTGKTSIASALSGSTGLQFQSFNASKDDKKKLSIYANQSRITGAPVVLLIDEIHRLDRAKQDYLLQFIEEGKIIVIGATTENPYISVVPAIRSSCQIFQLKSVKPQDILLALKRAVSDVKNGLGKYKIEVSSDDLTWLSSNTNGDVRSALNSLELAVLSTDPDKDGLIKLDREIFEECTQHKSMSGDKNGDSHYDTISAFQKSIRGSDADAALHYLARLLETGDIEVAIRRMLIIAFEDIGLSNPAAGNYTLSAVNAAKMVGLPEARIPLADAVIYLALSPKSNSGMTGINSAIHDLKEGYNLEIPSDLKSNEYKGARALGIGINYKYAHDYKNDWVPQQYLPNSLLGKHYLKFSDSSKIDKSLHERYAKYNQEQAKYLENDTLTWPRKSKGE